jgi:hypothetical protein
MFSFHTGPKRRHCRFLNVVFRSFLRPWPSRRLDTVVVTDSMRHSTMLMQEQTLLVEYASKGTASPRCQGAVSGVSFISNLNRFGVAQIATRILPSTTPSISQSPTALADLHRFI